jgi:DegV family protein with EDD domain
MAVQFIVDSASDILPEEAAQMGIRWLPLSVRFGTEEYADSVDLSHREFYEKLVESDQLPTTSQLPPAAFAEAFAQVAEAGDTAVVVTLSSKLSGTYQSACIAAEDYEGSVFVVDSENVTIGERILIQYGLALRDRGLSAADIVARLEAEKHHVRVMALLDTLEYLKKGGRISAAVALAGGLLSIKPVVAVEEGQVALVGKARGSKQGHNLLRDLVVRCGGINFDRPCCLAYSGLSDALLQKYITDSADLWQGRTDKLPIATVGCVIGTHVGPGAIAVAFFENEEA